MELSKAFFEHRRLETWVENQTSYTLEQAEMHVFETHQQAEQILLQFDQPVLATMLKGKKVMHLAHQNSFDFLPGESLLLPSNELMCIDFPEAALGQPTVCLAMSIAQQKINQVIALLNEQFPRPDQQLWQMTPDHFHFGNNLAVHQIIQRLLFLFTENHPSKDIFADFMLQELIIRLLQTKNLALAEDNQANSQRLKAVVDYIKQHLSEPLSIEQLSNIAHMSSSNFHRVFKQELGISPIDFINNERIKLATRLLQDPKRKIKEVYLACGFNSLSYFMRLFKKKMQQSPKSYQAQWRIS